MSKICKLSCVIAVLILFMGTANAQSKSVGCTFCFAGTGITYEYDMGKGSFVELQLRAETSSMFIYDRPLPGLSASFTWNMIFASMKSRNGNTINLFAGPGLAAGAVEDMKAARGLFFGLKGRIGGECEFQRKVNISICLSPVIGAHFRKREGMMTMLPYRFGLLNSIMPEVGVKYAF